ncbi:MAG: lipoate protein ligase C-terminal domain-containing protein [Candidatus Bathyarchaeota archaeon]
MMEGSYKAAKGLIRVMAKVESGSLREIQIAGDFFMYPEDGLWDLERFLVGTEVSREQILSKVKSFYEHSGVFTPGVVPEDFAEAIIRAVSVSASS